jgi:hypothetical protein
MSVSASTIASEIESALGSAGIGVHKVETRAYPDETNFVVYVEPANLNAAINIAPQLDQLIRDRGMQGFVVIRRDERGKQTTSKPLRHGVADERAQKLVRLISARSRVSESQPSLYYVRDSATNLASITAPRHHLIFGRRGAGKSALLSEGRRIVAESGALAVWTNIQTLRREEPRRVLLYIVEDMLNRLIAALEDRHTSSAVTVSVVHLSDEVRGLLGEDELTERATDRLVPQVQRVLRRGLELLGSTLYVFIDDFYYVPRVTQPLILDLLHGCVRDCDAWLKIASIRHLTRWFLSNPPTGLQTGQDADVLDLDVTLQDPSRAKEFLESVLDHYAQTAGVGRLTALFHAGALDRLILASGAVPRDYLVLCASAISRAQARSGARLVGVQDVNQAAGDAAQVKIQELEDDLASNQGTAERTLAALQHLRAFCLEETGTTYFRVHVKDKERESRAYIVLADLLDVRLVHLLDGSVSEPHAAGERSEAYMLDLSQFSGARLKHGIRVVDFRAGRLISHKTRVKNDVEKVGNTARQVLAILRAAPRFELQRFKDLSE